MESFLRPDFLKFFLPLIGGVIAWFVNERSKRLLEEYKRKEERYVELIKSLKGFYIATHDRTLKQNFLEQLKLCWLYCPDDVLEKANKFLSTVHINNKCSDLEKENALGELIVAIRKDLISRNVIKKTALLAKDFKHFSAT